jgi:aminomethyltransferase
MVPFGGYEMPVMYASILDEHRATRTRAGLFDVSHMGEVRLRGPGAVALAQRLFSNAVADMEPGRVRYGLICLPDGGVVDDATLYRVAEEELLFCINAANVASDLDWMRDVHARSDLDCALMDETEQTALLALQGPEARAIVAEWLGEEAPKPRRWRFTSVRWGGAEIWLSRTGYTGEDGYEIYAPADQASALWDQLLETGKDRVTPCGLGARDTLRTEAGLSLYGHELDRSTNPLEAGLERFVAFDRDFIGRDALLAVRERGPRKKLVGLLIEGRAVARAGAPVHTEQGDGMVTSGTFGPSVERSIAIGYVPAEAARPGARAKTTVRGRSIDCELIELPFYRRKR